MMKIFNLVLLVIVVGAVTFFNVWWDEQSRSTADLNIVPQRAPIVPASFTQENAEKSAAYLKSLSQANFNIESQARFPISSDVLPQEFSGFLYPRAGESVKAEKSAGQLTFYYAEYFTDLAMPENHMRLLRGVNPTEFTMKEAKRNELASSIEFESKNYKMLVTQFAISETRSKVMVYALVK